jgi:hypothetical protein
MPLGRLVRQVADKAQMGTHYSHKRPYGVGLIVAGVDESGEQPCPALLCTASLAASQPLLSWLPFPWSRAVLPHRQC